MTLFNGVIIGAILATPYMTPYDGVVYDTL